MRLQDLIADYEDFRRAMGHKLISGNERLQAFCRAVGDGIDACDVDLSECVLLIRKTKFYKSRLLPVGSHLKQALMRYATQRRESGHAESAESPFFVGRNGCPLKINTVQQAFRQLRQHAGIRRS